MTAWPQIQGIRDIALKIAHKLKPKWAHGTLANCLGPIPTAGPCGANDGTGQNGPTGPWANCGPRLWPGTCPRIRGLQSLSIGVVVPTKGMGQIG